MTNLATTLLPHAVYAPEQVRENEAAAAEAVGLSLYQLMQRAGDAVFSTIKTLFPDTGKMIVVCGSGNNAGDGFVVATLAKLANWDVKVCWMPGVSQLQGDATAAHAAYLAVEGEVCTLGQVDFSDCDVLVDAILGTGANKPLTLEWTEVVSLLNTSPALTVSIDIPSGIHAGTGAVLSTAVHADHTVTFIGIKSGLVTAKAADFIGKLHFAGLGVDDVFAETNRPYYSLSDWNALRGLMTRRARSAYKTQYGHVVCIGGDKGMAGAVKMAAESCLRAGVGLVTVITHPDNVLQVAAGRPELMVYGFNGLDSDAKEVLSRASVILAGPGMGKSGWANGFMSHISTLSIPMVVDADGLNWLAENPSKNVNWILTPHPGEAARLLKQNTEAIELDRYSANFEICANYGGVSVLKGAGSLISSKEKTSINITGNPGMATAGMGDVLAGITAAMVAQAESLDIDIFTAAQLAVAIHAEAGDRAAIDGERGMIATDLINQIRSVVNYT